MLLNMFLGGLREGNIIIDLAKESRNVVIVSFSEPVVVRYMFLYPFDAMTIPVIGQREKLVSLPLKT